MYELTIETDFAAAHQLQLTGRKCENLHGHNWKVEVSVQGKELDCAGVVLDFGELKDIVKQVMETLDHRFLNELSCFGENCPPSSENIARYIAVEVEKKLPSQQIRVVRVKAWESEKACAAYIPDGN